MTTSIPTHKEGRDPEWILSPPARPGKSDRSFHNYTCCAFGLPCFLPCLGLKVGSCTATPLCVRRLLSTSAYASADDQLCACSLSCSKRKVRSSRPLALREHYVLVRFGRRTSPAQTLAILPRFLTVSKHSRFSLPPK